MQQALKAIEIVGPATNVSFLQRLIATNAFTSANLDTGLIERHHDALFPAPATLPVAMAALWVAKLAMPERAGSDPWDSPHGWRLNGSYCRDLRFDCDEQAHQTALDYQRDGWCMTYQSQPWMLTDIAIHGATVSLQLAQQPITGRVIREGDRFHVFWQGQHRVLQWSDPIAHAGEHEAEGGRLTAPMPGKIVQLMVSAGEQVTQGAPLLIMEAMKMEHTISAPANGTVASLNYAVGDQVAEGAQLLSFVVQGG